MNLPARSSLPTLGPGSEKRTVLGRALRVVLEPCFYWGDWRGADGRPSFTKVSGMLSFAFGVSLLLRLWSHWFRESANGFHPGATELGFLLAFSFLVFCLPWGIKGLTVWGQTRAAGLADALAKAAEREPETVKARAELERVRAEIAARRKAGDDEYEVTV